MLGEGVMLNKYNTRIPEITYQDDNKLILKVQSSSDKNTFHDVTILRNPQRVYCSCIGGTTYKYCHHMKQVKGYTEAFIKQRIDINLGQAVKSYVYHLMSDKELGEKQEIVKNCLLKYPDGLTDKGIAMDTELSLSCVNGRRNELMHMGIVEPYTIYTYDDDGGKTIPNVVWGLSIAYLKDLQGVLN